VILSDIDSDQIIHVPAENGVALPNCLQKQLDEHGVEEGSCENVFITDVDVNEANPSAMDPTCVKWIQDLRNCVRQSSNWGLMNHSRHGIGYMVEKHDFVVLCNLKKK
jgi:hypothetical protein